MDLGHTANARSNWAEHRGHRDAPHLSKITEAQQELQECNVGFPYIEHVYETVYIHTSTSALTGTGFHDGPRA